MKYILVTLLFLSSCTTQKTVFREKKLFVIDGKVVGMSDTLKVKPNHIETIEVISDADAVKRYGSKGRNGAILITTKKNKK